MDDQPAKPNKVRILLIEDDPFLIKLYTEKFSLEGFEVLVAEDGKTGLRMATEETVNLVVLDLMIPVLSGIEVLKQLRLTKRGNNLPVIVLTNLTEKASQQKAEELGVQEFIIKADLTPGELVMRIKKALGLAS